MASLRKGREDEPGPHLLQELPGTWRPWPMSLEPGSSCRGSGRVSSSRPSSPRSSPRPWGLGVGGLASAFASALVSRSKSYLPPPLPFRFLVPLVLHLCEHCPHHGADEGYISLVFIAYLHIIVSIMINNINIH